MSMNNTPSSERVHIGIFGRRNSGKSSLINAITNQNLAIVSDNLGTTTDPVYKAMEILPIGAVMIIDTAGIDDTGELGEIRVKKAYQVLNKTDIAIVVIDGFGKSTEDFELIERIKTKGIPYVIAYNKSDMYTFDTSKLADNEIFVSAKNGTNINELRELIAKQISYNATKKHLVSDIIKPNDRIVLVIPIDESAPKGRLILPQQQVIRDILETGAIAIVCRDTEYAETITELKPPPKLVITDSQAFEMVSKATPNDVMLTSFSILFARYKGDLRTVVDGAKALDNLKDGDKILISEGCTHHRQCNDIGTVKLPNWVKEYSKKDVSFEYTSGTEFPDDLHGYNLVIHCGGCMLNEREVKYRMKLTTEMGIPYTNYGTAIAHIKGILKKSIEVFANE